MRTSKIKATQYSPQKDDVLIMDTNILIKILYPVNYKSNFKAYEDIYTKALQNNSKMLISSIQISEFINTCIRLQFNLYRAGKEMCRPHARYRALPQNGTRHRKRRQKARRPSLSMCLRE